MASVTINAGAFLGNVNVAVAAGLNAAASVAQREINRTLNQSGGSGGGRSAPGQPPANQTGGLARSWMNIQPATKDSLVSRCYSTLPLARWLERGAHIRPKNGKFLVFPVHQAAQRMVLGSHVRIGLVVMRLVMQGFLKQIKTDHGYVYVRNVGGKNQRSEIWFVATTKTDIAPRPYAQRSLAAARDGMSREFQATFGRRFNKRVPGGTQTQRGAP